MYPKLTFLLTLFLAVISTASYAESKEERLLKQKIKTSTELYLESVNNKSSDFKYELDSIDIVKKSPAQNATINYVEIRLRSEPVFDPFTQEDIHASDSEKVINDLQDLRVDDAFSNGAGELEVKVNIFHF